MFGEEAISNQQSAKPNNQTQDPTATAKPFAADLRG
jgi:hypothetical protein